MILAGGDEARPAAHRRADEDRPPAAERGDDAFEVLHHHVLTVEAVGGPIGIPVTASIECDGVVTGGAEGDAGPFPGMARLSAAMLEQHQRSARVAPRIAGDPDAARARPDVHRLGRSRQSRA